jgi:hypothetical protein
MSQCGQRASFNGQPRIDRFIAEGGKGPYPDMERARFSAKLAGKSGELVEWPHLYAQVASVAISRIDAILLNV